MSGTNGRLLVASLFQHLINDVLRDILRRSVVVYINDILVYSSFETLVSHVTQRLSHH